MDATMKALFGGMPISDLPSVQAIAREKKKTQTIWIMGGLIVLGGLFAYTVYQENQELKKKVKSIMKTKEEKEEKKEE